MSKRSNWRFKKIHTGSVRVMCLETRKIYRDIDAAAEALGKEVAKEYGCSNPKAWVFFYDTCKAGISDAVSGRSKIYHRYHWLSVM